MIGNGLGTVPLTDMSKSQLASFSTATAGSVTAAALAMVGLGPIGVIVGIGTLLVSLLVSQFQGCGQSCILTSQAANQVEDLLKQNVQAYMNSDRSYSAQQAALKNFDDTWGKLVQFCGNSQFGKAGTNCVQDRQAGACKWKNAGGLTPAGSGNQCWNWFIGYRDPIANDSNVHPDTVSVNGLLANVTSATGMGTIELVALGAASLVGIYLLSGK